MESKLDLTLEIKPRRDSAREIAAPYIFRFLHDDAYSRSDSNQKSSAMKNPITGREESIATRIWSVATQGDRYRAFSDSDYYKIFQNEFGGATIGITVFNDVVNKIGKFMTNPKHHSCVDEKISDLEHAMDWMTIALSNEDVRSSAKEYSGLGLHFDELMTALRRNDYKDMVKSVCCEEHEFVDLPKNGSGKYLRLIKNSCANGSCEHCGVQTKLGILGRLEGDDVQKMPQQQRLKTAVTLRVLEYNVLYHSTYNRLCRVVQNVIYSNNEITKKKLLSFEWKTWSSSGCDAASILDLVHLMGLLLLECDTHSFSIIFWKIPSKKPRRTIHT